MGDLRILFLEDLKSDFDLAFNELKRNGLNFEWYRTDNRAGLIKALSEFNPGLVISDYSMPQFTGMEALKIVKEHPEKIPFIILTGSMNEETAVECLKGGADDYVIKEHIARLPHAVKEVIHQKELYEQKIQAELHLQNSEENFRHSLDQSPLGIRIVTREGLTIYTNQAFLNIYEFSSLEEFLNTGTKDRYTDESYQEHLERKKNRKEGKDLSDYEISIRRKSGEIRHIRVWRKEVTWNREKHFQVICQDNTEKKRLFNDLLAAKEKAEESDRLKTAFLHNISHEIRTPMNAIIGFSVLLSEPDLSSESISFYTETITQSSNQLLAIINDIFDISNIEAGIVNLNKEAVSVNNSLKKLEAQFSLKAKEKNIMLNMIAPLPDTESKILADSSKFMQVMTNLLNNAFKFTSEGNIEFGYKPCNQFIEFFVSDSGVGIPVAQLTKIFDRFYQIDNKLARLNEGTGLGLSISKGFVELMGGKIWAESDEGKGSIFYFTLPVYNSVETESGVVMEKQKYTFDREYNILVAEDDQQNTHLIRIYLAGTGLKATFVSTGAEAVEYSKSGNPVDLVLMDLRMPVMDGFEATRLIKEHSPLLPVIAQTAFTSEADKERAISSGCNDFITKPFKKETLLTKIRHNLSPN